MSLTLMNTHRRDPWSNDDAADEEDDDVEEDEDEWDEAVTGGAASPCVPLVASAVGPGPRSGAGTSALISLSRGDALRSGDMDRARRCMDALLGVRCTPPSPPLGPAQVPPRLGLGRSRARTRPRHVRRVGSASPLPRPGTRSMGAPAFSGYTFSGYKRPVMVAAEAKHGSAAPRLCQSTSS